MRPRSRLVLLLLALWLTPAWAETLEERYQRLSARLRDTSSLPTANEQAAFGWVVSYAMLAEVRAFQATGSTAYLDRALGMMRNVLERRDDRRGVVDYRGRSLAA